jgi:hypothetical protein
MALKQNNLSGAASRIFMSHLHRITPEDPLSTNRRRFLESAAANAAALAMMPAAAFAAMPSGATHSDSADWDLGWTNKLKGKQAAVFDCTETESGSGVWRASIWKKQNMDVLKTSPADMVPVIVLRHQAIILAMQQSFWDKYDIGKEKKVTDPMTDEPTTKNPVLDAGDANLTTQMNNGAVVLACNMAFQQCISTIEKNDKVNHDEATKRAKAYLVPGVILQPSGVFAVLHAQNSGANYIKAS